jgi:hypothetical protein
VLEIGNRFHQNIARQRLSKHFPICNNIGKTVFLCGLRQATIEQRDYVIGL